MLELWHLSPDFIASLNVLWARYRHQWPLIVYLLPRWNPVVYVKLRPLLLHLRSDADRLPSSGFTIKIQLVTPSNREVAFVSEIRRPMSLLRLTFLSRFRQDGNIPFPFPIPRPVVFSNNRNIHRNVLCRHIHNRTKSYYP